MKKIYFRSRGGGRQGWGNIFRLITIYKIFSKRKYDCLFIYEGNKEVFNHLKKSKIKSLRLKENITLLQEKKVLSKLDIADATFIEMLDCNIKRQNIYKNISKKLIVYDDILKNKYSADLIICAQPKSKRKKIKNLFSDYLYYPLTDKFKRYLLKKKKINRKLKKILVCLGGGSYNYAYSKFFKYFKKTNLQVSFILGPENSQLYNFYKKKINNFKFYEYTNNLPKHIFQSDLVISGGGYLKIETAYLKTPMITIPVQKHQLQLCKDFKNYCSIDYLPFAKNLNNINIQNSINKMSYKKRVYINRILNFKFKYKNSEKKILNLISI